MIKQLRKGNIICKCVFNLNNGLYELEETPGKLNINDNSIIVELETADIQSEKAICLELIGIGYPELDNTYKKYFIISKDISISDGKIHKENIDKMFINNEKDINTLSTIILDIINSIDSGFFI